jgi:hypothetical protein
LLCRIPINYGSITDLIPPRHKGLKDVEEDTAVLGNVSLLSDDLRINPYACVFGKGTEFIERSICKDVPISQEEDPGPTTRLLVAASPVWEVPTAMEELPGDLKSNGCLAGSCCQRQQDIYFNTLKLNPCNLSGPKLSICFGIFPMGFSGFLPFIFHVRI